MSDEAAAAGLAALMAGSPYAGHVATPGLQQRAADLLEWVWTLTVVPYWPRRRRIIEADIVARTTKLGQGGWAAAPETLAALLGPARAAILALLDAPRPPPSW